MGVLHNNADEMIGEEPHDGDHRLLGRLLYNRFQGFYARPGGIVLDGENTAGITASYEGLAITNGDDSVCPWLNFNHATATINLDAGHLCSGASIRPTWAPEMRLHIQLGATVTSMRCWMGFTSGDPMASGDPAVHAAMFRYDTATDGTAWRTYTNDGTSTGTATAVTESVGAIAASTRYDLRIKIEALQGAAPNKVTFYINDIPVRVETANLPGAAGLLSPVWQIRTLAAVQRPWKFNQCVFNSQPVY